MILAFGYFLSTFENGIGNISQPTIKFLKDKKIAEKTLAKVIVYMIQLFWFIAQNILLIVLLNFVIALISQYYEDVMNSKVMHQYIMK